MENLKNALVLTLSQWPRARGPPKIGAIKNLPKFIMIFACQVQMLALCYLSRRWWMGTCPQPLLLLKSSHKGQGHSYKTAAGKMLSKPISDLLRTDPPNMSSEMMHFFKTPFRLLKSQSLHCNNSRSLSKSSCIYLKTEQIPEKLSKIPKTKQNPRKCTKS